MRLDRLITRRDSVIVGRVAGNNDVRNQLEQWLDYRLRPWFADRILEIGENVILTSLQLVGLGRGNQQTFLQPDLSIAATASVHRLCLVTRNVHDFIAARIPVLNPWTDDEPRVA